MEISNNYVFFNSYADYFGVDKTVVKFQMNFCKVAIFRQNSKQIRVFRNAVSRRLLEPENSYFVLISHNCI